MIRAQSYHLINPYNRVAGPQDSGNPFIGCLEAHRVASLAGIQGAAVSVASIDRSVESALQRWPE